MRLPRSPSPALALAGLVVLLGAGLAACAGGQRKGPATLTEAERASLIADLDRSRDAFLASVKGLSEAQLRWKPAPDRWSVIEVAEHIALAEQRMFDNATVKMMKEPLADDLRKVLSRDDDRVRKRLADRTNKRNAIEALRPSGRFPTLGAIVADFSARRARNSDYVRTTSDDLRSHGGPHPALGALDSYQWLVLMAAHTGRHTAQIEELKADPGFPKS